MESFMNSQYEGLNASTDANKSVSSSQELQQQVAAFVQFFEKRSLFPGRMQPLSDESCTLEVKVEALFEQYRKMAVGKTAAELVLVNSKTTREFTDIKSKYKSVLDPAGVLMHREIPLLKDYYQHWQEDYDLEVVLISLDTDPIKYAEFYIFPWVSSCFRVGPGRMWFSFLHRCTGQGPENTVKTGHVEVGSKQQEKQLKP
jgi:hypothetical protein